MKIKIPNNLRTEKHPFKQLALTSYIIGGLAFVLGIILLLMVKQELKAGFQYLAIEKMIAGISFITIGSLSLYRAYQREGSFDLEETFDPSHGENLNYLMGQRTSDPGKLASQYSNIMHSRSYSLAASEKGEIKEWQVLFYKLISKKNISKLFDHLPYPITQFIANQSKPISLLGSLLILLISILFISYLEIFAVDMTFINIFILIALLSFWRPTRIDTITERNQKDDLKQKVIVFIIFFIVTIGLYQQYSGQLNIALFASILLVACIMVYAAILAFSLIEKVFANREMVNVSTSSLGLKNNRAFTQPNNILQQFDNTVSTLTGWFYKGITEDSRGILAGDQNRKGDFKLEYLYETLPTVHSSKYDAASEEQLIKVWKIGTGLICTGFILFFIGIIIFPGIDADLVKNKPQLALQGYSPKILLSLFFILFGIAINFFGRKLAYEIYLFFNTEVFFESNLILFSCAGNYDEYEHTIEGITRKDTSTDFTWEVKVSKVISSVFMHPYMEKGSLVKRERFVVKITENHDLLPEILTSFKNNLGTYMTPVSVDTLTNNILEYKRMKNISNHTH